MQPGNAGIVKDRTKPNPDSPVLPKDDTQHNAELRQAFLKHLPRRIEMVQKRAQRLAKGAWDINLLGVLAQETQALTGACGKYGLIEASERLYNLELLLTDLLCDSAVPEPSTRLRLEDLAAHLISTAEAARPTMAVATDFVLEPAASTLPFPNRLVIPAEFWRRFSQSEVELLSSTSPGAGTQPPPPLQVSLASTQRENRFDSFDPGALSLDVDMKIATTKPETWHDPLGEPLVARTPESTGGPVPVGPAPAAASAPAPPPKSAGPAPYAPASAEDVPAPAVPAAAGDPARVHRAYVLAEPGPFAREVTTKLIGLGLAVDRIDNIEELKETLGSLAPDLVVIEELFANDLEHLGEFIRRIRPRLTHRMVLCAVLPNIDLAVRLKAMRAGIDVVLPMPVSAAEVALRAHEAVLGEQGEHYRIMIVEDDRSQALFAESVLRKAGMETCAVTDPLDTIASLEKFRPDLILMDLYMPGIDGMELTAIIREREDFISTPIVFLSGEQDSEKHFEALSAGGDDFLAKPIRPKHLISAVTNRARRARSLNRRRVNATPRDAETGLYDRAYALDQLGELFGHDDLIGAVAFVELDRSAALREQYGVAGLDTLIAQLSSSIVGSLTEGDFAARYGDASLLVVATRRRDQELAGLANGWRSRISAGLFELNGAVVPLQVSIGISGLTPELADPAAVINAAERAMIQARQPASKERVRIWRPEASPRNDEEQLLDALHRALRLEDFQMLFQPIVALSATGQELYEVLLRLRTDDGKLLSAPQFLPVAVKHGLSADIDRFTLSRSLSIIDERRRQGRSLKLFVNQSAASMLDPARAPWVKQMLDTRKLPGDSLTLEFALPDVLAQLRAAIPFFQAMRGTGVKLALDQFESNLTALQLLGYLPIDYLKLSPKYLGALGIHGSAEELRALVAAAHDGGRAVIAARVENAQTAASLWSAGVDLIQGNFVQQPGAELGFDFNASTV